MDVFGDGKEPDVKASLAVRMRNCSSRESTAHVSTAQVLACTRISLPLYACTYKSVCPSVCACVCMCCVQSKCLHAFVSPVHASVWAQALCNVRFSLSVGSVCAGVQVWYLIPPSRSASVQKMLRSYVAFESADYALHSLTVQLSPSLFLENRIPLYRVEQKENEFLMLWPRTYHAGFNLGWVACIRTKRKNTFAPLSDSSGVVHRYKRVQIKR